MLWRRLHALAAIVWVAAIVVQVFLAGQAIANLGGSGDFSTHIGVGYTIGIIQLVVVLTALVARMPRRDILISVGILVLYIVQTILPGAKDSAPWIAALHPLNAMILFTISIWYAWHAWRAAPAPAPAPAPVA
jgi:energy-coupling factor transporter transmembrane protein EcfT